MRVRFTFKNSSFCLNKLPLPLTPLLFDKLCLWKHLQLRNSFSFIYWKAKKRQKEYISFAINLKFYIPPFLYYSTKQFLSWFYFTNRNAKPTVGLNINCLGNSTSLTRDCNLGLLLKMQTKAPPLAKLFKKVILSW